DLNIILERPIGCARPLSGVFQVTEADKATGLRHITVDGVEGNPGCGTFTSWFQIQTADSYSYSYQLAFCPSVCDLVNVTCRYVGVDRNAQSGMPRFVLSDTPHLVRFHKPCRSNKL
ncbi:Endopeptidase inhibitor, partial [Dorcoceras hygrometricum]